MSSLRLKIWSFPSFGHFSSPPRNQSPKQVPLSSAWIRKAVDLRALDREGWSGLHPDGLQERDTCSLKTYSGQTAAEMLPHPLHDPAFPLCTPWSYSPAGPPHPSFSFVKLLFTLFCSLSPCFLPCYLLGCLLPTTPQELPLQLSLHETSRLSDISVVSLPFGLSHIGGLAFGLNAHPSFRPSLTFPHSLVSWPTGHGFCILALVTGKVWGQEGAEGSPTATIRNLITDQPWLPSFIR